MAENESPMSDLGNWQEAIDRSFQERLVRPSVKPGVIDRNQLAGNILERSQQFANRVSLPPQLERHLSGVKNLPVSQIPIVYAQSVKSEAIGASGSANIAPANPPVSQGAPSRTVQAKLVQTADFTGASATTAANSATEPMPVVRSQSFSQMQAQQPQPPTPLATSQSASPGAAVMPSLPLPTLQNPGSSQPRIQRKLGPNQSGYLPIAHAKPLTGAPGNVSSNASGATSQPPPTPMQPLPTVQARYSDRSSVAPKTPNPAIDVKSASGDRAPKVQPLPPDVSAATGNQSPAMMSQAESPLPVVQVANSPRPWLESQPHPMLQNQAAGNAIASALPSNISSKELGTPLILSIPPSFTGQEPSTNNNQNKQNSNFQAYNPGVGETSYNPASAMGKSVYPESATPPKIPSVNVNGSTEANIPTDRENDKQLNIDVDALTDKIERKLIRRLAIENERRGQGRWR